jgi:hypothetical protein
MSKPVLPVIRRALGADAHAGTSHRQPRCVDPQAHGLVTPGEVEWATNIAAVLPAAQPALWTRHHRSCWLDDDDQLPLRSTATRTVTQHCACASRDAAIVILLESHANAHRRRLDIVVINRTARLARGRRRGGRPVRAQTVHTRCPLCLARTAQKAQSGAVPRGAGTTPNNGTTPFGETREDFHRC